MSLIYLLRRRRVYKLFVAAVLVLVASPVVRAVAGDVYETVSPGTKVTMQASADGSPLPTFQWTKNGQAIPGATGHTLVLPSASTSDAGIYNAIATNSAGWALSHDLILSVGATNATQPQETGSAPSFTLQPFPSATAPAGSSLTLSATAVGNPTPTYQWRKNGTPILGATNASLTFAWLTANNAGTYSVVATNSAGSATSNDSVVTVEEPKAATVAPSFTVQPEPNAIVPAGSSLTLTAEAVGTPSPTYQWQKNDVPILGATNSTLTFAWLTAGNSGTYTVVATNSAGSTVSRGTHVKVQDK